MNRYAAAAVAYCHLAWTSESEATRVEDALRADTQEALAQARGGGGMSQPSALAASAPVLPGLEPGPPTATPPDTPLSTSTVGFGFESSPHLVKGASPSPSKPTRVDVRAAQARLQAGAPSISVMEDDDKPTRPQVAREYVAAVDDATAEDEASALGITDEDEASARGITDGIAPPTEVSPPPETPAADSRLKSPYSVGGRSQSASRQASASKGSKMSLRTRPSLTELLARSGTSLRVMRPDIVLLSAVFVGWRYLCAEGRRVKAARRRAVKQPADEAVDADVIDAAANVLQRAGKKHLGRKVHKSASRIQASFRGKKSRVAVQEIAEKRAQARSREASERRRREVRDKEAQRKVLRRLVKTGTF